MGILPDWMIKNGVKITPMATHNKEEQTRQISYGVTSYGYDARVGYVFDVFSPINATEIDPKNFDRNALHRVDISPHCKLTLLHEVLSTMPIYSCSQCGCQYFNNEERICPKRKSYILIPPHSFALAETIEHFEIPRDTLAVVVGKSTYARCGVIVNVTPLEPEWKGKVTIEISNTTHLPVRIYGGEGIMQIMFFRSDAVYRAFMSAVQDAFWEKEPPGSAIIERLHNFKNYASTTCDVSYADKKGKYQNQTGLTPPTV